MRMEKEKIEIPASILAEKLRINTFNFGTTFPNTAKTRLTRKFTAITGAAIRMPILKIPADCSIMKSPAYSLTIVNPTGAIW